MAICAIDSIVVTIFARRCPLIPPVSVCVRVCGQVLFKCIVYIDTQISSHHIGYVIWNTVEKPTFTYNNDHTNADWLIHAN